MSYFFSNFSKQSTKRSLIERDSIRSSFISQANVKKESTLLLTGYYDENTNINEIHQYIVKYFDNIGNNIISIDEKINTLKEKLNKKDLQMVDINYIKQQINKLENEKHSIRTNNKYKEYLERVKPVLDEFYKLTLSEGPYFRFGEEKKFSPDKLSLVRVYIQIASEYISLNLTLKPIRSEGLCPYCRKQFVDDEDGKIICYDCGIYQDSFVHDVEFKDIGRINGANNNNYANQETFDKAKVCYQGQQQAEFPPKLFEQFDEYCKFNKKNKRLLTYETTRPIFKEIGYSQHYDDINLFLFMHPEIKKPLPDIREYEEIIDQDYKQFYQKFIEIKGEERESGLNSWYLLYILLRRRKIKCNKCDFKIPDTNLIRINNDNIARRVFQALGWKFEDTV